MRERMMLSLYAGATCEFHTTAATLEIGGSVSVMFVVDCTSHIDRLLPSDLFEKPECVVAVLGLSYFPTLPSSTPPVSNTVREAGEISMYRSSS